MNPEVAVTTCTVIKSSYFLNHLSLRTLQYNLHWLNCSPTRLQCDDSKFRWIWISEAYKSSLLFTFSNALTYHVEPL